MTIVDTHNHLYFPGFKASFDQILKAARDAGVEQQVLIGIDELSCQAALNLATKHNVFKVALGLHPCDVDQLGVYNADHHKYLGLDSELRPQIYNRTLYFKWLDDLATQFPDLVVAFGETGFDQFHRQSSALLQSQSICFKEHLKLCLKHQKTLIIHSRGARNETLKFLEEHAEEFKQINFVWHCFSEDLEAAQRVIELGGYLGVGGVFTYPKSEDLRAILKKITLEKLLTETDSPFLIPHEARKQKAKLNNPSFLPEIIETITQTKELPREIVEAQLIGNAQQAFPGLTS